LSYKAQNGKLEAKIKPTNISARRQLAVERKE
jgi:hypothetical protein